MLLRAVDLFVVSATLKNTFWLGSASLLTGLLGAISSALLARLLGVSEFGTFTLLLAIITTMTDLGDLGLTTTFVRFGSASIAEKNLSRFRDVLAVILRIKLAFMAVIICVFVFFLQQLMPLLFGHVDEQVVNYLGAALAVTLLGIAASIFYPIFQSYQAFRSFSVITVVRGITKLALIVLAWLLLERLAIIHAIWIESAAIMVFVAASLLVVPFRKFTLHVEDRNLQKTLLAFNRWILLAQVLSVVTVRLDIFFVGGWMDASSLGIYGAAAKIASLAIAAVNSYYTVLLAGVSSASSAEVVQLKVSNAWKAVGVMIAGFAVLFLLARPLVSLLFGGGFDEAGPLLQYMCVGLVFTALVFPPSAALFARNQSSVFTFMAVASLVAVILGNVLLIPRYGARGAAMAFCLNSFTAWVVSSVFYLVVRSRPAARDGAAT